MIWVRIEVISKLMSREKLMFSGFSYIFSYYPLEKMWLLFYIKVLSFPRVYSLKKNETQALFIYSFHTSKWMDWSLYDCDSMWMAILDRRPFLVSASHYQVSSCFMGICINKQWNVQRWRPHKGRRESPWYFHVSIYYSALNLKFRGIGIIP